MEASSRCQLASSNQELVVSRRHGDRLETLATMPVRFVPMVKRPQIR